MRNQEILVNVNNFWQLFVVLFANSDMLAVEEFIFAPWQSEMLEASSSSTTNYPLFTSVFTRFCAASRQFANLNW